MEQNIKRRIRIQILALGSSILLIAVLIFTMTAAWFTNVSKTSNLSFQTESWGFDTEKITVSDSLISIAPGTSGVVPLSVDNSENIENLKINVMVSKTVNGEGNLLMEEEMQKRLYFYVDTPKTYTFTDPLASLMPDVIIPEETESVNKVYLGSTEAEAYLYDILAGQMLSVTENYSTHVPVKWEWVYDMTGYYFRGKVDETLAENKVVVNEYLRPIEYDPNQAVYNQETGQAEIIEGMTVAQYLNQYSLSDGYKGSVSDTEPVIVTIDNYIYYKIDVDDAGYGVWAYLCTLSEIEEATVYDTALLETDELQVQALMMIQAWNVPAVTETVNTEDGLKNALANPDADVVQLSMDVSPIQPLNVTEGTKVLDLNGYTLTYDGNETSYEMLKVSEGATLIVTNGQISGNTDSGVLSSNIKGKAITSVGANVILNNVIISDVECAIDVSDMTVEGQDSTVQIINCDLSSTQTTVVIQGNGSLTDATSKIYIENSRIYSESYVGIIGQGNVAEGDERWGTELVVTGSEIYGLWGALYQPQKNSVSTFTNCKLSGNTGIAVKGGTVNIIDCEIIGLGDKSNLPAAFAGSGYTDTGDAVYLEAGYPWPATINLKGNNVITSNYDYAVEIIGREESGLGKVVIYDGVYTGELGSAHWNKFGSFEIYGGEFNNAVDDTITRYDQTTETEGQ